MIEQLSAPKVMGHIEPCLSPICDFVRVRKHILLRGIAIRQHQALIIRTNQRCSSVSLIQAVGASLRATGDGEN